MTRNQERGLAERRSPHRWMGLLCVRRTVITQEFKPGEIVPQSGIYTITHDPAHADMPHEVTAIKGRRFPTCGHS